MYTKSKQQENKEEQDKSLRREERGKLDGKKELGKTRSLAPKHKLYMCKIVAFVWSTENGRAEETKKKNQNRATLVI